MEVDSSDAIRLVLQFLKENNLLGSARKLERESGVVLNPIEDPSKLYEDVKNGRWADVLRTARSFTLSKQVSMDLYEHIVLEMIQMKEYDTAGIILSDVEIMDTMKRENPDRYLRLNRTLRGRYDTVSYVGGASKSKRREEILDSLQSELTVVRSNRLLCLLQSSLKWESLRGNVPANCKRFDLLRGAIPMRRKLKETFPRKQIGEIRFGKSEVNTVMFSPNGCYLATGTCDGFVEIWDHDTCKHRAELEYQSKEDFMMNDDSVLSLAFSLDSELLASGSIDGSVMIWRVRTGKCLRRLEKIHSKGVTGISFSPRESDSEIATCSYDGTAKIHGLRSGRTLKEFRGHNGYVNNVTYCDRGNMLLTASSDGTVNIYNVKSARLMNTLRPPQANAMTEIPVSDVVVLDENRVLICNRSDTIHVMTLEGKMIRSLSAKGSELHTGGGDVVFVSCTVSPKRKWIYCLTEDSQLFCFEVRSGLLKHIIQETHQKRACAMVHHPHFNMIATVARDCKLRLWG